MNSVSSSPQPLDELPGAYICPRCHGALAAAPRALHCLSCPAVYPVSEGVPYLFFEGRHWYRKLRELVLYSDYYEKIKNGRLERDRFSGKESEAKTTFGYMRHYFDVACAEIDFSTAPRILDVGAGCGEVSQRLAEAGAETYAVDMNLFDLHHDARLIAFADLEDFDYNRVFRGVPIERPLFRRAIADADHLPFADGYFDYVVMRATAHHVLDLHHFFAEMSRVLRSGGRLILITEPLASILDEAAEYTADDVDWQEGMTENRPRWTQYAPALAEAGFGNVTVRYFHAGFGYRMTRLLRRLRLSLSLESQWERPVRGWKLLTLPFVAGAMNVYAVKKREPAVYSLPVTAPAAEPPLADLLVAMADDVDPARELLRRLHPEDQLRRFHDFARPVDRDSVRGVREAEPISGRAARYLLTDFFCLLDGREPLTRICIELNAEQLRGQKSPRVLLMVDDQPCSVEIQTDGWTTLCLPLPAARHSAVELRIQQPDLIRREFERSSPDRRDVGLAVRRVWTE